MQTWRRVTLAGIVAFGVLAGVPSAGHAATVRELSWHLDFLRIDQAHAISQGEGVTVAVIDSGVDVTHRDLAGQVLPGTGIGQGTAPDGHKDSKGHGTAMAGTIAAKGGGAEHLMGIAPKAKILPVALPEAPTATEVILAIHWAVEHGANVINMSLAGQAWDVTLQEKDVVADALAKNVVIVASAGNVATTGEQVGTPGKIPGVLAVAGVDKKGMSWDGSSKGAEVALAAPAVDIASPKPFAIVPSGYGIANGTSDSSAMVAGVAALVRAKYPTLDAANVINRLVRTAQHPQNGPRDSSYGFGVVNPVGALTAKVAKVGSNPLLSAVAAMGDVNDADAAAESTEYDPAQSAGSTKRHSPVWPLTAMAVTILGLGGLAGSRWWLVLRRRTSHGG